MNQSKRGFSLLELIFTLFILSTLSTIGLYYWQKMHAKNELLFATETTLMTLQSLKKIAHQQNKTLTILAEMQNKRACLKLDNETICFLSFDQVEISLSTSAIIFYGERATAQSTTLTLKNNYGETKLIIATFTRIRACALNQKLASLEVC